MWIKNTIHTVQNNAVYAHA